MDQLYTFTDAIQKIKKSRTKVKALTRKQWQEVSKNWIIEFDDKMEFFKTPINNIWIDDFLKKDWMIIYEN